MCSTPLTFLLALTLGVQPGLVLRAPSAPRAPAPETTSCTPCHTCRNPMFEDPCLGACLRMLGPAPPTVVILDELAKLYGPVTFDHRIHADMAELTTGCVTCHHGTPEGAAYPACRTCHAVSPPREDFRMPGLKGAYHRQCMSCHREWSHATACNGCHAPNVGALPEAEGNAPPGDFAVQHAAVRVQPTYVYTTDRDPLPVVTFHHVDHAGGFGLGCADCHRGDSCGRCHDATAAPRPVTSMSSCRGCHGATECGFCHDQTVRPPFDHAMSVGWPLEPYHLGVACTECHGPAKTFDAPPAVCHACHARRQGVDLDHQTAARALGQRFHELDCLSCHEAMKTRLDHAAVVHGATGGAAGGAAGCTSCHDPSRSGSPRVLPERQREVCLGCHDKTIDTGRGRPLANIAALLAESPDHHGPVREGNCCACHQPHASDHARLLIAEYPSGFYAPFDDGQYTLCFGCHGQERVSERSGARLTGFRDGDLNLHWLHVNREKGRTCRACHEVHASSRPFHIRESVPFGAGQWMFEINYERTIDGGACAPGCHAPQSYRRSVDLRPVALVTPG